MIEIENRSGELAPEAVKPPGEEVAVNDDAVPPVAWAVKVTVAAPLLYARLVPTSVAVPMVGASGTSGTAVMPGINVLLETLLMIVIKDVLNQEISEPNTVNERFAVEA